MEYRALCDHYYSVLTYIYALDDAYYNLKHDIDRSDLIYEKFQSIGYKSVIELSAKFVTYLELFVGLRWCLRELFGYEKKHITGWLNDPTMKGLLENYERGLPIIDSIWWFLRNEIHHSKLPKIRPCISSRMAPGGKNQVVKGHMVPVPLEYPDWIDESEIQACFFGEEQRTFSDSLSEHYVAVRSIHEQCLELLVVKSEKVFKKGIEFSI